VWVGFYFFLLMMGFRVIGSYPFRKRNAERWLSFLEFAKLLTAIGRDPFLDPLSRFSTLQVCLIFRNPYHHYFA